MYRRDKSLFMFHFFNCVYKTMNLHKSPQCSYKRNCNGLYHSISDLWMQFYFALQLMITLLLYLSKTRHAYNNLIHHSRLNVSSFFSSDNLRRPRERRNPRAEISRGRKLNRAEFTVESRRARSVFLREPCEFRAQSKVLTHSGVACRWCEISAPRD